jgi:ABC-2 type transport system ATP-binding protein
VLRTVSLEEKQGAWVEKLSGGQKQRLAVACALVGDPELLFLDEPTTGLDPQSRLQLWDVVLGFKKRGRTVLLTTHYMDEAERLCDRVGIVDHGKMIALGTPRELISSLGGQEVIELAVTGGKLDESAVGKLSGVHGVRHVADGFALAAEPLHVALPAVLDHVRQAGLTLERLSTRHATLEDVFVAKTGRGLRD